MALIYASQFFPLISSTWSLSLSVCSLVLFSPTLPFSLRPLFGFQPSAMIRNFNERIGGHVVIKSSCKQYLFIFIFFCFCFRHFRALIKFKHCRDRTDFRGRAFIALDARVLSHCKKSCETYEIK
jgi:hypothetical protein